MAVSRMHTAAPSYAVLLVRILLLTPRPTTIPFLLPSPPPYICSPCEPGAESFSSTRPPVPLSLFVQALSVLGIRPLRPMAAYEGGGGIGGKFPKRPFRRAPATPYERPPAAVRPARGHPAETRGNGWLSKLVDPASRIIAWSASRLFSSVFQKRLGPPPAAAPRMTVFFVRVLDLLYYASTILELGGVAV
ncbi:hypothetical protein B296_00002313 [Ensete ventricosum]|uniref:Uncharacterized protein n=1 Tax=Ensete ventricosum TaxID=4639 RepID=A0A427BAW3_ENSVE|nr:hypothetical protein B296_00002313 [Ensete ventricosum]